MSNKDLEPFDLNKFRASTWEAKELTLSEVYKNSHKYVVGFLVKSYELDPEKALGIYHQSFLVFLEKLKFDPEFKLTSAPRTFLVAIARNLCLKLFNKHANNLRLLEEDYNWRDISIQVDLIEILHLPAKRIIIANLINTLREVCQWLLKMHYYENMDLKTIAEEKKKTPEYVRVNKHRCLNELRELITQKFEQDDL